MAILLRNAFQQKPRFLGGLITTIGWRRSDGAVLHVCPSGCRTLHISIGDASLCPRARGERMAIAEFGPAPPAILEADDRARLTDAARAEIDTALERLDKLIAAEHPEPPTLDAYAFTARGVRSLVAWCGYCKCWHRHGGGKKPGGGNGHRAAHCHVQESPYRKSGYFLKEVASATAEIRRDLRRRRPRGPKEVAR